MKGKWVLRKRGVPLPRLWWRLRQAAKENICYGRDPILGFPGTLPVKDAVEVLRKFSLKHPNNIGVHTGKEQPEAGFEGTHKLEREFIYTMGSLVGAADPETQIDGYICMGGTEGNDHGMWLGRNRLFNSHSTAKQGIAVLTSFLAHYSIVKHFGRLFPSFFRDGRTNHEEHSPGWFSLTPSDCSSDDTNVLRVLPTNAEGELTGKIVDRAVREFHKNGYRRFLIVLTAGTTNLGSVDQIPEISSVLAELKKELCIGFHVHVDAAFGGFVLPFLEPEYPFGFQNDAVSSVSLDAHKMGYAPYSSGIFLCRKGLMERYTRTSAEYLRGRSDTTVCGSRSGSITAACWTAINRLGREGYRQRIQRCLSVRDYLRERLLEFNHDGVAQVELYPSRMNIQTVRFSNELKRALESEDSEGEPSIKDRFCIPCDDFPPDMNNLPFDLTSIPEDKRVRVFRFTVMPHVTRKKIDQFVDELRARI